MDGVLQTEIWQDTTLGDLLTIQFLLSAAGSVLAAAVLLVVGWIFASWVGRKVTQISLSYPHLDKTLFNFLGSIARYTVLAFAILIVLNTFGVRTTSIVAAIGAAGIAVGLALQGTLSNIAAGVMIILFRPLKIGDFVEVAGRMGTVQDITLNYTELADLGNVQVIIPNSDVWGNVIENYSSYPQRRAEWTFGVGYETDLGEAERVIRETITADPRTDTEKEMFLQVNNWGDSSVDFLVRAWVATDDWFAYQADMKRKVKEAFDAAGIEIPYPTRTLLRAETEETGRVAPD